MTPTSLEVVLVFSRYAALSIRQGSRVSPVELVATQLTISRVLDYFRNFGRTKTKKSKTVIAATIIILIRLFWVSLYSHSIVAGGLELIS
jgi:uncharacterized membrane protein YdcZ (DUF606 family)